MKQTAWRKAWEAWANRRGRMPNNISGVFEAGFKAGLRSRDPLQKQKDAVVRAAEHMDRFADWSIMTRSGQTAIDHLRLAVTALQSSRSRRARTR